MLQIPNYFTHWKIKIQLQFTHMKVWSTHWGYEAKFSVIIIISWKTELRMLIFLRTCNSTWHNTNHAFRITNHALGFKWITIHALGILNENYESRTWNLYKNFWFTRWESWMKHMMVEYNKHSIPRPIFCNCKY